MKALDDLFRRFATAPYELAKRLSRFQAGEEPAHRAAAIRWCDWVTSLRPIPRVQDEASAYELLMVASTGQEVFRMWLAEACQPGFNYRGEEFATYDSTLLNAMLFLWPSRDDIAGYQSRLCAWAHAVPLVNEQLAHTPMSLAESLCAFPDVAYELLAQPPLSRWADAVQKDPALSGAYLALYRRLRGCAPCEQDERALEKPAAAQYLEHDCLRRLLRELLAKGTAVPELIWPEVDRILGGGRDVAWYQALALLTGYLPRQNDAVALMAATLKTHPNPKGFLELLSGSITDVGNPFRGHGWARGDVGPKLLPMARVMVARGVWPTSVWLDCLRPCNQEGAGVGSEEWTERAYDRVKRVLGEALLERASDPAESIELRRRAVRAIGLLVPADDSNLLRSLGRFYENSELCTAAKDAQREARDRARASHIDGELCVMDAWEYFSQLGSDAGG